MAITRNVKAMKKVLDYISTLYIKWMTWESTACDHLSQEIIEKPRPCTNKPPKCVFQLVCNSLAQRE